MKELKILHDDSVNELEACEAVLKAWKEIDTQIEYGEGRKVMWDLSKNVPGYSVKLVLDGADRWYEVRNLPDC